MSDRNENDWVYQIYRSDPTTAFMTEDVVRTALAGFPLEPSWNYARLAVGIQWALHTGLRYANSKADEKSNAEVRDELRDLAERTKDLCIAYDEVSDDAKTAMWNHGYKAWVARRNSEGLMGEPAEIERFRALINEMSWLGHFLEDVTAEVGAKVQPPKWRGSERQSSRVWLGRHLATIFEAAFDVEAVPKSGGMNSDPASLGHWPDFFCRVIRQAGIQSAGANLGDVMREVRRLHVSEPVLLDSKMVPE